MIEFSKETKKLIENIKIKDIRESEINWDRIIQIFKGNSTICTIFIYILSFYSKEINNKPFQPKTEYKFFKNICSYSEFLRNLKILSTHNIIKYIPITRNHVIIKTTAIKIPNNVIDLCFEISKLSGKFDKIFEKGKI